MDTFLQKRQILQEPHGVTSQKTPLFIVTAVKTSNLTRMKSTEKPRASFEIEPATFRLAAQC
jgi:hypothetical protein